MTPKEAAALLNGRQYREEITRAEAKAFKDAGLVVVYGASDDLMEFDGAIRDEFGSGELVHLTPKGLIRNECDDDDCPYHKRALKGAASIEAHWCAEPDGPAWTYSTAIPHDTFMILEDDELYCRGIVFALADVPA